MISTFQHFNTLFSYFGRGFSQWKRRYCQPEIPEWMRTVVLLRDRNRCQLCGNSGTEVDHVKPLAFGGKTTLRNLRTLCVLCHRKETNRVIYGRT